MIENIEEVAQDIFFKNLSFYQKSHHAILAKILSLNNAIENGLYIEKYELLYENGYFDVVEKATSLKLYGSNSLEYAQKVAKTINFLNNENVFETFKKVEISNESLVKYKHLTIYENNLSGFADIINYISNNKSMSNEMTQIDKFIFFGTGLGTHILEVDKKISAKIYLIVEDDLELFRLSMFVTPYYKLATKSELIFAVFESKDEFANSATKFLNTQFYYNHYIKYFNMLSHNEEKLKEFHIRVASQSHNLFFYNSILEQYLKPLEYVTKNFKFLNILHEYFYETSKQKPFIILAAGPSLQHNILWLKNNQDKFIIIALSAVLSILEKEHIKPDIVTHIDGLEESIIHFTKLKDISFFQDSIFLLSARTPNEIIDILYKENIFLFESGTSYKKDFGNISAPCIGSTTYLLTLAFGARELYLLGLDLALDSKTGSTHSIGHEYSKQLDINNILIQDQDQDIITFKNSIITTQGNFDERVYTTIDFKMSIDSVNATSLYFKKEYQKVYNLSLGAKFLNTIPKPIEEIDTKQTDKINKKILLKDIYDAFNKNSHIKLTKYEISEIQERFDYSLEIKKDILNFKNLSFNNSRNFLDELAIFINKLSSSNSIISYDIALVYQEYFRLAITYIYDFFNMPKLQDEKKHINIIKNMLCSHLLDIIELYADGLNQILMRKQ